MHQSTSHLTGCNEIDEVISEISNETVFDIETAKHFYLITGNKEFCVKLSYLHSAGYPFTHLEFLAKSHSSKEAGCKLLELSKLEEVRE